MATKRGMTKAQRQAAAKKARGPRGAVEVRQELRRIIAAERGQRGVKAAGLAGGE